ncbi:MAG: VOC family protein, partial [Deltaproteobacteria bacterium]|nr:VOC family protein [Deltaproteobacteria bacterium]
MVDGSFTWLELVTPRPGNARSFYAEVLGWRVAADRPSVSPPAVVFEDGCTPCAGLRTSGPGTPGRWRCYLNVDDLDARVDQVSRYGGAVVEPPADVAGMGRCAQVVDPQGAHLMLRGPSPAELTSTALHWHELWSPRAEQVLGFYCEALRYAVQTMSMYAGAYHVLRNEHGGHGGVITAVTRDGEPRWLPYVRVDDCDATVERARRCRAAIATAPRTVPSIGRIAIITDH